MSLATSSASSAASPSSLNARRRGGQTSASSPSPSARRLALVLRASPDLRRRHLGTRPRSTSDAASSSSSSSSPRSTSEDDATTALKDELLTLLGKGGDGAQRMARVGDRARLESLVTSLEAINPTPRPFERPELLLNEWRLVTTFQPGTADVSFFSAESWRKYLLESGPSPVQSLVVGNSTVDNVYQVLRDDPRGSPENGAKVGDDSRHLPVRALAAARFATCTRYPPISRPRD